MPPDDRQSWSLQPLAESERELFRGIVQFYLYDFSEFDHEDVQDDGRFHWDEVERYGRDEGYDAWLLRVSANPAGFALIDQRPPLEDGTPSHAIAEFFILRAYRRSGHGEKMARAIFDHYPGHWRVAQIAPNLPAIAFWRRIIGAYTGDDFREFTLPMSTFDIQVQEFTNVPK